MTMPAAPRRNLRRLRRTSWPMGRGCPPRPAAVCSSRMERSAERMLSHMAITKMTSRAIPDWKDRLPPEEASTR